MYKKKARANATILNLNRATGSLLNYTSKDCTQTKATVLSTQPEVGLQVVLRTGAPAPGQPNL